jgi:ABC-type multidrug transport system ATPase subunit
LTDAVIEIRGVCKRFGEIQALDEVGFEVPRRTLFGLLGPNGAGKTTLFSIVANFLRADRGSVEVLGVDTRRVSELCGRMTILPQDARFQRNIPVLEQLTFFRMLDGKSRPDARREVEEGLELVGLREYGRRGVQALSHGMVKRLGIAQAFLGSPEVILLDEPTAGLDPANAKQIRDLVLRLKETSTIVISSHNLAEIQELCDAVAILDRGRVVTTGPVAELTASHLEVELAFRRPLDAATLAAVEATDGVRHVDPAAAPRYTVTLDLDGGARTREEVVGGILRAVLEAGAVPHSLRDGRSLERHFLEITGESAGPAPPGP